MMCLTGVILVSCLYKHIGMATAKFSITFLFLFFREYNPEGIRITIYVNNSNSNNNHCKLYAYYIWGTSNFV